MRLEPTTLDFPRASDSLRSPPGGSPRTPYSRDDETIERQLVPLSGSRAAARFSTLLNWENLGFATHLFALTVYVRFRRVYFQRTMLLQMRRTRRFCLS